MNTLVQRLLRRKDSVCRAHYKGGLRVNTKSKVQLRYKSTSVSFAGEPSAYYNTLNWTDEQLKVLGTYEGNIINFPSLVLIY